MGEKDIGRSIRALRAAIVAADETSDESPEASLPLSPKATATTRARSSAACGGEPAEAGCIEPSEASC